MYAVHQATGSGQVENGLDEIVGIEWLGNGGGGAQLPAGFLGAVSGEDYHGFLMTARGHFAVEGAAVHVWHLQIKDDDVEVVIVKAVEAGLPAVRGYDVHSGGAQAEIEHAAEGCVIVDDENTC
jgi:hypothetical protein